MSEVWTHGGTPRRTSASPYDAQAAVQHLLARLRASAGATRVSIWVHEASGETLVPFAHAVRDSGEPVDDEQPRLCTSLAVSRSPLLSAAVATRRPVTARADGRRAEDRELAGLGIRSAHAEPLVLDGDVVGVLTVEPSAAAAPHLLRQVAPRLALALAEAWLRRSERRRLHQAGVLLELIESAARARSAEELLDDACRRLAELDEVERACVFRVEDGRLVPIGVPMAEAVLRTGEPVAADRGSGLLPGWWADRLGIASALAVPLGRAPHLAGVLVLGSSRDSPFPEDVHRLAAAAGAHLGAVLEQLRTSREDAASPVPPQAVRQPTGA